MNDKQIEVKIKNLEKVKAKVEKQIGDLQEQSYEIDKEIEKIQASAMEIQPGDLIEWDSGKRIYRGRVNRVMSDESITLHRRRNNPSWKFMRVSVCGGGPVYICKQKKNEYRLFWDGLENIKPVWIGKLNPDGRTWVSVEKQINADHITVMGGTFSFDC